jgi:hypothetical protein
MLPGGAGGSGHRPKTSGLAKEETSDLVKAMVGLLALGKSDFEAIEPFRRALTDRSPVSPD